MIGLARMATAAFRGADLKPLCRALIARAEADADDADGLLDLSVALQLVGQRALGLAALRNALALKRIFVQRADATPALRLLLLLAPGDLAQNNTVEFLLEARHVTVLHYYVDAIPALPDELPEHDVLMVGLCESQRNRVILQQWVPVLANWPRPVLNRPEYLVATARDAVSHMLAGCPGLHVPPTCRLTHGSLQLVADGVVELESVATGLGWPFIVRPVDSQKGNALSCIESTQALMGFLAEQIAADYYVAPYVDYRSDDGLYRKFRIMFVAGEPYLCHVAISESWVVHYMSAGMTDDDATGAAKRNEEARWMREFDSAFLPQHGIALAAIAQRLGLEYVGIDCGITHDGRLLLFEVDAGMTIHLMDPPERFPYKPAQMARVCAAFEQMLHMKAAPNGT